MPAWISIIWRTHVSIRATRWSIWLWHCASSRQVAPSISDEVVLCFHWYNPSGHTMALGPTQPLTKTSTRDQGCRSVGLKTLSLSYVNWLEIIGESNFWNPKGLSRPAMGYPFMSPSSRKCAAKHMVPTNYSKILQKPYFPWWQMHPL